MLLSHVKNIRSCALSVPHLPWTCYGQPSLTHCCLPRSLLSSEQPTGTQGKLPVCLLCIKKSVKKTPKLSLSLPPWTTATNKGIKVEREGPAPLSLTALSPTGEHVLTLITPLLLSIFAPVGNNPNQGCRKEDRQVLWYCRNLQSHLYVRAEPQHQLDLACPGAGGYRDTTEGSSHHPSISQQLR